MSEELKLQLAERMPGVISAMADAAGFGADQAGIAKLFKAMEGGEVKAAEVLPEFAKILSEKARAGGALTEAMKTSSAEQQRFNNAVTAMIEIMGGNGLETGFARIFKSMAVFLEDNTAGILAISKAFEKFSFIIERVLSGVTNIAGAFEMLSDKMGISHDNMALMAATALILATRFGRIAAAAGVIFLVLEDIAVGMKGGESFTKDLLDFLDENSWVKATAAVTGFALALGGIAAAIVSIGGAMGGIPGAKGSGGKGLISAVVGSTVELVKKNPKTAAVVGGMIAYDQVASAYHSSDDPKIVEEREQIKMRIANLQRGPNAGYLTEMTNKYPLPGVNSPLSNNTTIERVEIKVDGSKDPELVGQIVLKKIQELASDAVKNLPLTE